MLSSELRGKIDRIWDAFYSGGISNPLETIEQITYLLFLRRLDQTQINLENAARWGGQTNSKPIFAPAENALRWKNFRQYDPQKMFVHMTTQVFPWLQKLGGHNSTYAAHMKDARFSIPTPALLGRVVDLIDELEIDAQRLVTVQDDYDDIKGDIYEYLLSKLSTAGRNGQFRTPRHIIDAMVKMLDPQPGETICDPACGTAGFLVHAALQLKNAHGALFRDAEQRAHFNERAFRGFDFDATMLRIASMNMMLHGVENPQIAYRDSLSQGAMGDEASCDLILANPPFAGSLDYSATAKELLAEVKTRKTELLFLALILRLLKAGGRAAVIVPDGVLFGASGAHQKLRQTLVEKHKLQAIVSLPGGVFKPYAGVSTAIVFFTKTGAGGTDRVWFYDVRADGFSLDDKRTPGQPSDLPDLLERWWQRESAAEGERARSEPSFWVEKAEIAANGYDLSLNRYKQVLYEAQEHRAPVDLLHDLRALESQIAENLSELENALL